MLGCLQVELQEVVDFFTKPQLFRASGARIPRGVLLCGPPGTGKTLLARAVAGESGVAFLSLNASEFVEMFVGVGAARVRDLFNQVCARIPKGTQFIGTCLSKALKLFVGIFVGVGAARVRDLFK